MANRPQHATLVFERLCAAPVERVFRALADAQERARWSVPSDDAAFFYEETDFRIGGRDRFRCGDKENPELLGTTTYLDIIPNQRIVASETVEEAGLTLMISLVTTVVEPHVAGTKVTLTSQLVSFGGDAMIEGTRDGNNAALDNLVDAMVLQGDEVSL